ncbi:type 4a pilus biogenesis protein PilO [Vandammella animalimorsus]|uniref:Pilus assembly protein PilO n=1 Tax=Vandammella animalimorsus TaxID=2029117 RepID=A0A2A2AE09_9BURK|nr:type 4a pilus biogenesis protein PilO [Vandammella animalimorsus]PAT35954.1 pilus assembly protein PilO [Vandammella animalimorsus]
MASLMSQFQQTSGRDPWLWPIVPRLVVFVFIAAIVAVLLWFLWLVNFKDELEAARAQEETLRAEFSKDYKKAINLDALKKQREQAIQYVNLLEKQLPNKAEMAALLSDINQAGVGRGLQFESFKPGAPQLKDYYAEQPIEIMVTGTYDAIGEFLSDIAHLSRIVTVGNMEISKENPTDERLGMKAIVVTYRYLDPEEVASMQREN